MKAWCRTWLKLHLVDDVDTYKAVCTDVSFVNVGDSEVLPTLLDLLRREVTTVYSNCAYSKKSCYEILKKKGHSPLIPPRKNAALC